VSSQSIYAHGKLLITGEYFVLHGAESLAVPLQLGQRFTIKPKRGSDLHWQVTLPDGSTWFKGSFSMLDFTAMESSDQDIASRLSDVLNAITRQNPDFLSDWKGQSVECHLEFHPDWGLGSSSSLLFAMAEWAQVDPWLLLDHTTGGSGYDLACADAQGPIIYQNTAEEIRITPVELEWPFKDQLHLVWSGRKQRSNASLLTYGDIIRKAAPTHIQQITDLTLQVEEASDLATFLQAMQQHNDLLAHVLGLEPNVWAPDFPGLIKPLGAWGGDFFLAASHEDPTEIRQWLNERGFSTLFSWKDLVLES
jgi:mevalonate kinase